MCDESAVAPYPTISAKGVAPRASGVLERLEDDGAGPFADDEPVPPTVKRARRGGRVVVPGREGPHRGEARDHHLADRRLRRPGDHDVGVAAPDRLPGLADGVTAGGAGRRDRDVRALRTEGDRGLPGREIRDRHRDEERADPLGARG